MTHRLPVRGALIAPVFCAVALAALPAMRPAVLAAPAMRPVVLAAPVVKAKASKPAPAKLAPAFTLQDADGKSRSLAEFRGRPVTLFFYCGCEWCQRCASLWAQFQRGGALPTGAAGKDPVTLVVYSGDAVGVRQFATETGLSADQTVLLTDPQMDVTLMKYDAEPCPRVFVVDPGGRIVYTNDHSDDAPRKAPEMVIASRALDALRRAASSPAEPKK
jgi:peroxiredoxin